jgi:hypothetical protein
MKRLVLVFLSMILVCSAWAGTPVENLVVKYKDTKGAKSLIAEGFMMTMARPFLKAYSIAPLADKVQEMSVLRMDKVSIADRKVFLEDMYKGLCHYIYVGKSDSPNGLVDAYVHLSAPDVADELVVYNPELVAIYALKGEFTAEELRRISKKP